MLLSTTGTGASSYNNDADGNTLTGGGRTNTWDSQNRSETASGEGNNDLGEVTAGLCARI